MIVVDASAVVEVILRAPLNERLTQRLFEARASLHAPHLIDVEVTQVIRRYWLSGEITGERAGEALADFRDLRIHRYPHEPLLSRVWTLRHNLTAYDAVYVALAEALDAPLLTGDGRIAGAPGHGARVEVV